MIDSNKKEFINELEYIARQALAKGQFTHALKAYEMIGKTKGLFGKAQKNNLEANVCNAKMDELDEAELDKLVYCLQQAQ